MIKIYGKCMLNDSLQFLAARGCTEFEVHTTEKCTDIAKIPHYKSLLDKYNISAKVYHTPMSIFGDGVGLGNLNHSEEYMKLVKDSIVIANSLIKDDIPKIVVHAYSENDLSVLHHKTNVAIVRSKAIELAAEQLSELLEFMTKNKLEGELCVENVPSSLGSMTNPTFAVFGSRNDAPYLVNTFNDKRVKLTLDLCHILIDINLAKMTDFNSTLSIRDYIAIFAERIGLVHFNNYRGFGFNETKQHSVIFEETDSQLLSLILRTMLAYGYDKIPWTLEVVEPSYIDFSCYTNYELQRNIILKELKALNVNDVDY